MSNTTAIQAGAGAQIVVHSVIGDLREVFPRGPGIAGSLAITAAGVAMPAIIRALRLRSHKEEHNHVQSNQDNVTKKNSVVHQVYEQLSPGDLKYSLAAFALVIALMNR